MSAAAAETRPRARRLLEASRTDGACEEAVARLALTFAPVLPRRMSVVPPARREEAARLFLALRLAGRSAPYAAALVGYLYRVRPPTVRFWYARYC